MGDDNYLYMYPDTDESRDFLDRWVRCKLLHHDKANRQLTAHNVKSLFECYTHDMLHCHYTLGDATVSTPYCSQKAMDDALARNGFEREPDDSMHISPISPALIEPKLWKYDRLPSTYTVRDAYGTEATVVAFTSTAALRYATELDGGLPGSDGWDGMPEQRREYVKSGTVLADMCVPLGIIRGSRLAVADTPTRVVGVSRG